MSKLLSDDEVFGAPATGGLLSDDEVFGVAAKPPAPERSRSAVDIVRDVGVTAIKGAIRLPESFVGLADIPTGGRVGKALEDVGYRPAEARKILDGQHSEAQQEANRKVDQADGFVDTAKVAIENPSTVATAVGESIFSMIGGAGVARSLLKAATKVAPVVAGAIGEGTVAAGSAASSIRGETADGLLTPTQSLAAVGTGVGTGILGFAGGKLAQRLGVGDVDTILASGAGQASAKGFVRQVLESGVSEGVFEELPQSAQEQMWQNFATGKPIMDGVGNAAAMGMLAGAAMGGAGGGYNAMVGDRQPQAAPQPDTAPAPEIAQAATPERIEPTLGQEVSEAAPAATPAAPAVAVADPFARLAELELAAEQRPLTPAEETEAAALVTQLQGEDDANELFNAPAPAGTQGLAAEPLADDAVGGQGLQGEEAAQEVAEAVAEEGIADLANPMEVINPEAMDAQADPMDRPAAVPKIVIPPLQSPAQPTTTGVLPQTPAAMNLPPEVSERLGKIEQRLATLAADAQNRTPSVQNSMAREAARLEAEKTEIVQQAKPAPQPQGKAPKAKAAPIMRRNDLVGAIMRVTGGKGISAGMAQTVTGDTANRVPKLRGLFTKDGIQDLDDTAELLRVQEGYDVRDGEHLSELLREAAAGNVAVSMERTEREAQENEEKQYKAEVLEQAKRLKVKHVGRKFADVEQDVNEAERKEIEAEEAAEREAILAAAEVSDDISEEVINRYLQQAFDREGKFIHGQRIDNEELWSAIEPIAEDEAAESDSGPGADQSGEEDGSRLERGGEAGPGEGGSGRGRDGEVRSGDQQGRQGDGAEGLALTGQTNEEAAAAFAKEQAGEQELTKEQIDREAAGFSLQSQSQASPKQAPTGGQGGLFTADGRATAAASQPAKSEPKAEPKAEPEAAGEMDALKAEMAQAIDELASILGAKTNLTPEEESRIIPVMSRIFRVAAKMGYIKFKDAAGFVLGQIRQLAGADVADKLSIENLQAGYINIAKEIGGDKREAMSYDSIEELENTDVIDQRSSPDLERNRQDAEAQDGVGEEGVSPGRDGDGVARGPGVQGTEGEGRAGRGRGRADGEAAPVGKRGDQSVYRGASEPAPGSAGSRVDSGSGDAGIDGMPVEPDAASQTRNLAQGDFQKQQAQLAQRQADKTPGTAPGIESVKAALPILKEGQQEDVVRAEARFAVPDGYGMLFTNGTGTGKTFTGLGTIKRFANQGKTNILVVAPNDKIIEDWQRSGKLLGLDLVRLENTNDAGKGMVITTYANMGQNPELAKRDWDLIVNDEAHYLAMDKDGTSTSALETLRAISLHPDGAFSRANMIHADLVEKVKSASEEAKRLRNSDDQRDWTQAPAAEAKLDQLLKELDEKRKAIKADVQARQMEKRPRVLFLSATPFAYEKTVDWANGYLFDYDEGQPSEEGSFRGYNAGSNRERFFMQHFGYRMRYNKLTEPDAKVDRGLMQRQFNGWLKKRGALHGRMLDVAADYDRRFILVDSAIGARIDDALQWFEVRRKAGDERKALGSLRDHIGEKFDYLSRRYLLEAIKAREVIPHVKEHLAMGRKVVVFHDYKKGGGFNPFNVEERIGNEDLDDQQQVGVAEWNEVVREFRTEFRDLIHSDLFNASSPITAFKKEFPDVLLFNGDVSKGIRREAVRKFQDDDSGPQVILVQSDAGKEGISLHDTTGKHQRVLFNLGQPTKPTTAIQQEGRIYRTGQVTDAIFRYLNTGTNWEKWAFATTIAQRASAAENLGMGELARALKDAFIAGFEESGDYRAGMDGEGKGGKERDRAANEAITQYDRARAFYFGTQKKNSKTKAQEGADYFATPEPVGLKMVEFADIRPGEKVLEPSAGHGAIARWFPDDAEKTTIEPSMTLRPRLAMVFDGNILDTDFEAHNIVNKYDAIVMNPPFGVGGKTAVEHLAKAAGHLRDGGRVVALLPTGPAADKRFDKWLYEEASRNLKPLLEHPALGAIYRGDTVTTRAGWMPEGKLLRRDTAGNFWFKKTGSSSETMVTPEAWTAVKATGPRTETYRPAEGFYLVSDIKLPAVTFERAGTGVMTRIAVIEKQSDASKAPASGVYNRDFTNAADINELFDRMEDMALPKRPKEEPTEEEAPATKKGKKDEARRANTEALPETGKVQAEGEAATVETVQGDKLLTDAPRVEHVTQKGKTIYGVIARTLTKDQAKAIDAYTWAKDGGFFIRMAYVTRPGGQESRGFQSVRPKGGMAQLRYDMVAGTAKAFRQQFKGAAALDIRVANSRDEIPREHRPSPYAEGVYHDTDGVIYLIAQNLPTKLRTWQVLMHEAVGHYGLANLMGEQFADLQGSVLKQATAGRELEHDPPPGDADYATVEAVRRLYPEANDSEIAQEVLARMAETLTPPSWGRAALAKIRQWLKSMAQAIGVKLEPSLKDARDLVLLAAEHMREGANLARDPLGQDMAFASNRSDRAESRTVAAAGQAAANWWQSAKAQVQQLTSAQAMDNVIYHLQDKFIDLRRVRERIQALQGTVTDLNDAYQGEELYHGRVAKRTEDFLAKELKPLLAELRAKNITLEAFEEFLHARHAPEANAELAKRNPTAKEIDAGRQTAAAEVKRLANELNRAQQAGAATKALEKALNDARGELARWNGAQAFQGTEAERLSLSGMSDAAAAAVMAKVAGRRADFDALAARVDSINEKTLQLLEQYGLMDRASIAAWRQAYKHYVPLHRDEAHPDTGGHPVGQGFSVKGDASKRRTGSNEKVTHILGHIAMQREAALTRGEKNNVTKKLYLLASQNPDKDFWTVDQPPKKRTVDEKTGFVQSYVDPLYKSKPNVVMLRIAGKDAAVVFNEHNPEAVRLAGALKNLDVGDMHMVFSLAAKGTRWFASINTQYNPIFGLINLARDSQAGILNLSSTAIADKKAQVVKGIAPALRAVYLAERGKAGIYSPWVRLWEDFQRIGGQTGYRDLYTTAEDRANALLDELKALDRGKVKQAAHAIVDWLSDYNTAMENAVRLSAYKAALDKGLSKEKAASIAKNLTVNFNRKGSEAREVGALYAFFNASIQGTARMAQTLAGPAGKKIIYGGVAVGLVNTLLGMAMMGGGDDDNWEKIPEFVKERSLIIPISREDFLTIPMPLGFHVLPNIGRLAAEFAFGGKDKTAGRQLGKLLGILSEAFNPIGSAGLSLQTISPTVLDPIAALAENRDWTGKPIYRENRNANDPVPGHARAKDSASAFSKATAKAINAITGGNEYRSGAWSPTPDQLDYVIGQLTGGLGREGMKLEQTLSAPFTGDELPAHKIPLAGRLYGNTRGASGNSDKFNDNIRTLNEVENEAKGRAKDRNGFQEYLDGEALVKLVPAGNSAENQVQKLRTYRRDLVRQQPDGYKDKVRQVDEQIALVMKDLNRKMAEAERGR
jgi:hypothetical protein